MAVSCPEVMYGAYYPYLYGRAGPSRSFYQYERFNQDLYSSSGVNLAASSSASGSSHSPCSPILPPSVSANAAAAVAAAAHNSAAAAVAVAANQASSSGGLGGGGGLGGLGGLGGGPASGLLGSNVVPGSSSVGSVGLGMSPVLSGAAGHSLHSSHRTHAHAHSLAHAHTHPHSHTHTHTHQTKEEDLIATRSEAEARLVGSQQHQHHNESSCSSGPDSPRHAHSHSHPLHVGGGGGATGGPSSAGGTGSGGGDGSGGTGAIPKNLPTLEAPMGSGGGGGLGGSGQGQAQYLSASCVVFTNYSGDTASQVDEHFSRALNYNNKDAKESSSPMSNRNFPPSFWNSNYVHPIPAPTHHQVSDLYGTATDTGYATDPWVPHAAHYGSYAHAAHAHAAHAHAYHHNMAQYGSLLRLPQQYASHGSRLHHDQQTAHALEYSSYPTMAGLEAQVAQVQESSKDLYWF